MGFRWPTPREGYSTTVLSVMALVSHNSQQRGPTRPVDTKGEAKWNNPLLAPGRERPKEAKDWFRYQNFGDKFCIVNITSHYSNFVFIW
jgi:hypothetical protein